MVINKIRSVYSIIGDFVDFLIRNEQRIKNMMLDYEIQTKIDPLKDGREVKTLLFSKKNISVRFLPNRIDYEYNYPAPNVDFEIVFGTAKEFYALLGEIFPEIIGNRIAIILNGFIHNQQNQTLLSLVDRFQFSSAFGDCNEFAFKINSPKQGTKEYMNEVLSMDMGGATNNTTKETLNVMLVSLDVNTLGQHQQPRFSAEHFAIDFKELQEEVEAKCKQIEAL